MTRDNNVKYMTFYEDGESIPGKRTAVWEIDKSVFLIFTYIENEYLKC